ncbi:uncharacterized protein ARMOST_16092 [Armillaria ostoyae]|uniref:Uncharacterized protein n=1 Tax=Armillaria ostoyae TaxID=47428 RepID=A0A284RV74_ARMOS|nr:uncharacterized protein ARMOST_16092 [Armillaria ostoyae]
MNLHELGTDLGGHCFIWFHPCLLCSWIFDNLRTGSPFQSPALLQLSEVRDSDVLVIDTRFDLKTVGKIRQQQNMNSLGADGNFDYGSSDAIAYPNIYQAFGDETAASVSKIQSVILGQQPGESNCFGADIQYPS